MRRLALLAACSALAVAASGCGAEGGGSAAADGAGLAPASAALFVALDTDSASDQWQTAEALVEKFPDGRRALDGVLRELEEDDDVTWERDVRPALGSEVDLVLLDLEDDDAFVGLTQPEDPAKLRALAEKGEERMVLRELEDGWWAFADSEALLDEFAAAREDGSLEESDAWADATGDLPEEALVTVFLRGEALAEALRSEAPAEFEQILDCLLPDGNIPSIGLALSAEEDGVRLTGASGTGGIEVSEGETSLAGELPGGAVAYVSVHGLGDQVRRGLRCASDADEEVARQIAMAELGLGVSIDEDILPLFDAETAIGIYPPGEESLAQAGAPRIPVITLATQVEDEEAALDVADRLADRASAFVDGVQVEEVDVGGVSARRVTIRGETSIFYAVTNGMLVVTSAEDGILALGGDEGRLEDDEDFDAAREAAGVADEHAGLVYANLAEAIRLFVSIGGAAGADIPDAIERNLEPLRSLVLWGEVDGDRATFEAFLQID